MPTTTPQRQGSVVWLIAAILAFLALALGMWDLMVERDGEANWLGQAVLPLLLLVFALAMYRRHRGSAAGS